MKDKQPGSGTVPKQEKGSKSDTLQSKTLNSREEAISLFKKAKNRLEKISDWHKLCGLLTATFAIVDSAGNKTRHQVKEGDYIRIDIPAPGTKTGDGYDWVRIESITVHHDPVEDVEEFSIKVRPADNPTEKEKEIAHFFKEDATSTFMVCRNKNTVTAEIHGRNELPNVKQLVKMDSVRNTIVALGAMFGFSKWQWSELVKGIIDDKKD